MPNWCENKLIIKGKRETIKEFLNKYFTKDENGELQLDFDKIIPEPRTIEECPKDCIRESNSSVMERKERPWFDWYEWHIKYWGTKWDACDTSISWNRDKTEICILFDTAWSPSVPVIDKLRELEPELKIKHYFYEPGMCIAGYTTNNENGRQYEYGTSAYRSFVHRFYYN